MLQRRKLEACEPRMQEVRAEHSQIHARRKAAGAKEKKLAARQRQLQNSLEDLQREVTAKKQSLQEVQQQMSDESQVRAEADFFKVHCCTVSHATSNLVYMHTVSWKSHQHAVISCWLAALAEQPVDLQRDVAAIHQSLQMVQ